MQRPTRDELIALAKADPEAIADLVLMLWDRVEALEKRIAELERNSRTSSKPPSTDKGNFTNQPKPKPKSLRQKSKRKTGGQKGHPGSTLEKVSSPDKVTIHDFAEDAACPDCGSRLDQSDGPGGDFEVRQVFDLPPIELEVTEHRARRCHCPDCGKRITASFPEEVKAPVQYGPRVQAAALYLGGYQLIPYGRLSELFDELFNAPLSEGTLANIVKRGSQKATLAMEPILALGYSQNPEPPPNPKGQRGKVARGKALNLLDRFDKYREEILGFFLYPGLYPYDNNLAERDVRMTKVREKISGTFRSEEHAKGFCSIRSIISSGRKQGRAMLATLGDLVTRPSELGLSLAKGS